MSLYTVIDGGVFVNDQNDQTMRLKNIRLSTEKRIDRIECNANVNACPPGDVIWLCETLREALEKLDAARADAPPKHFFGIGLEYEWFNGRRAVIIGYHPTKRLLKMRTTNEVNITKSIGHEFFYCPIQLGQTAQVCAWREKPPEFITDIPHET